MDQKYLLLNDMQQQAVFHTEGPLLILAGAGSGKTRVLTHRIAYLLEEKNVQPWQILAITFTNKAAKEMKERVTDLIGYEGPDLWVSTFHSACVRILRRHIELLGYDNNFVIYDTDDQKNVVKSCLKELDISDKNFQPRMILGKISSAKDDLKSPEQFMKDALGDYHNEVVAKVYKLYQKKLVSNNALDFDDIIFNTVKLFQTRPEILEKYQERFKYIMVDEYQDTNTSQYTLIRLLAAKYRNLCVVGDDDQSIYKFRGANIRNILDFEKDFNDAFVVRLEQNYRCTKNILEAANQVIKNNVGRKRKTLWTDNDTGMLIKSYGAQNEHDEAGYVVKTISESVVDQTENFRNYAILYRTNAQSRVIEESCMKKNIPYRLYGGTPFYQRKEIKDIICYLRTINNASDDLAVTRIINVPKRSIGATTVGKVSEYALLFNKSFMDALYDADNIPGIARGAKKLKDFVNLIGLLRVELETMSLVDFMEHLIERIGYKEYLKKAHAEDFEDRIDNINELISKVAEYEEREEEASLDSLLEEIALVAAIDNYEEGADVVTIMTLHSAKGLEFPIVFMTGLEEGLFPSYMSITSDDETDVEEERRLCYVGITRAQKQLYICNAKSRMVRGQTQYSRPSRFLEEIPDELLEAHEPTMGDDSFGNQQDRIRAYAKKSNFGIYKNPYTKPNKMQRSAGSSVATPSMTFGDPTKGGFNVGDVVKHKKFGVGKVLRVEAGGADQQLTISFMKVGVKKLLASLSGIQKVES